MNPKTEKLPENKYIDGKIYCIKSPSYPNKMYIGSTYATLNSRFNCHIGMMRLQRTGRSNKVSSFDILAYPDAYIELLELHPCDNRQELIEREKYYMDLYKDKLVNKYMAGGHTSKEYYQRLTPEKRKEYNSNHYEKHKNDKPILCKLCNGKYSSFNKYHHLKTKKHINSLKL